jgi:hypothetical protein
MRGNDNSRHQVKCVQNWQAHRQLHNTPTSQTRVVNHGGDVNVTDQAEAYKYPKLLCAQELTNPY